MKNLKTILQYKYFYILILIISIIYTIIKINYYPIKSIINENDNTFLLTVKKIRYANDKTIIEFIGEEKLISYYKGDFDYKLGDKLKIKGSLNNVNNNTIPNNFNYKNYLKNNQIYYLLDIENIEYISSNKLYNIKNYIINKINKMDKKEYIYAFILGESYYIKDEVKTSFQNIGISHLLAIGSNSIELLIISLSFICKKLKINNKIYIILFSLISTFYVILTDFAISILRCTISKIITQILNKKNIKIQYHYILILLFSITLLINPYYIFNKGFQYSYLISYTIVKNKKHIKGNYLKKLLIISTISYIISLPITIQSNYEINLLAIFYNLFYVPFINIIIFPLTIIVFILPIFGPIYNYLINILEQSTLFLNKINITKIIMPRIPLILLIVEIIILFLIIKLFFNNKRYILLILLTLLFHYNYKNILNETYISFLDVKQGDSSLLKLKNKSLLIDTGGLKNKEIYQNTLTYLKSEGIRKINYLILTHGDFDHMGETINLVNNFKVEKVIFNCGEFNDLEKELISVLNKKKIKYYSCISELNINNNKLYFLNNNDYGNENDNSIVLYTELNNKKFLFMGDASVKTEKDIINKYNLKDIDVIKVGHHGSKTSSSEDFIQKINPKYSVISVGKNNIYKHPNSEILKVLDNSKIYRTDQDGSIIFKFENNKLEENTCPP